MRTLFSLLVLLFSSAAAGEAGGIPQAELQALDRAIAREMHARELGAQTLGDLQYLRDRLHRMASSATGRAAALEPPPRDDTLEGMAARLEKEAGEGSRTAARSLALYRLFLNDPEGARAVWRRMGPASSGDLPYLLLTAYLDLALGEYNSARATIEAAGRLIDARTGLELSRPIFCDTIAGYRLYVPRDGKDLLPGEDTLIYVEVDGVDFLPLEDGHSECRIMFGLKLMNDLGRTVWAEPNYGEYAPVFAGPIRDLHTALSWRIPNNLEPGLYRLQVEAVENATRKHGENRMEFTVARRAASQESRSGTALPPGAEKTMRDASRTFSGAPLSDGPGTRESVARDPKYYEIIKKYENMQRGD